MLQFRSPQYIWFTAELFAETEKLTPKAKTEQIPGKWLHVDGIMDDIDFNVMIQCSMEELNKGSLKVA